MTQAAIPVIVNGALGKMGRETVKAIQASNIAALGSFEAMWVRLLTATIELALATIIRIDRIFKV